MHKLSDIYDRKIYSRTSDFVGIVKDVLIDPAEAKIKFLLKEQASSILKRDRTEARKFVKDNFIPFENVEAVGDIILIK